MSVRDLVVLTGLSAEQVGRAAAAIKPPEKTLGRPHALTHLRRVLVVLVWLRTNLTERGLAVIFGVSQPTVSRIIDDLLPLLAGAHENVMPAGPEHVFLDGTLIPVHDQSRTAKAKNYRRSINAQIACTHQRRVCYVGTAWPGNRNDIVVARETVPQGPTYKTDGGYRSMVNTIIPPPRDQPRARRRHIQVRARAEHVIARMKDWQVLRQCRGRGDAIDHVLQAVAFLHNVRMGHVGVN